MDFAIARRRMVDEQLAARGIGDQRVLTAMNSVPRHAFVAPALQGQAYSDSALPIGEKQTISQPYTVAMMTTALELCGTERVLEIGTGSGYQTALLAKLAKRVYSVERIASLAAGARKVLDRLSLVNVNIRVADGTRGWPEQAPFDAILVAAGAPDIPQSYLQQLEIGGRLVLPVGDQNEQTLLRITRLADQQYRQEQLMGCRFVPLIGESGWAL